MPEDQLEKFRELRDYSESRDASTDPGDMELEDGPSLVNVQDILDGSTRLDMSHAGGEFIAVLRDELEEELSQAKYVWDTEELHNTHHKFRRKSRPDYRVRDDRTQNLVNGWKVQMDRLVPAYMAWCAEADLGVSLQEKAPTMVEEIKIHVVDLYGELSANLRFLT